jgi:drug/metabolite transporter (DMT)-like permease
MPYHPQSTSMLWALGATLMWGTSDFVGGYAARRANAFLLTMVTHVSGTSLMTLLALGFHMPFPEKQSLMWAVAAGLFGGVALAVFYRALSAGNMGLTAPVAAVLGAAIPTAIGIFIDGMPGPVPILGFFVAALGIWLISRGEGGEAGPAKLGLAAIAGAGFAGYFLCIRGAGSGAPLWLAAISRGVSFVVTGLIVLLARQFKPMDWTGVAWGLFAGVVDSTGSSLFIRGSQSGRLDTTVIISSLYPAVTVLLARTYLNERFTPWKVVGLIAALLAVPMVAWVS